MNTETEMVRKKVTVTIDKDLVQWVDKQVEKKIFRNRSHAFERALDFFIRETHNKEEKTL